MNKTEIADLRETAEKMMPEEKREVMMKVWDMVEKIAIERYFYIPLVSLEDLREAPDFEEEEPVSCQAFGHTWRRLGKGWGTEG